MKKTSLIVVLLALAGLTGCQDESVCETVGNSPSILSWETVTEKATESQETGVISTSEAVSGTSVDSAESADDDSADTSVPKTAGVVFQLKAGNVPEGKNGQYPADGTFNVFDVDVAYSYIQSSHGKLSDKNQAYIQMKKEVSYFMTQTAKTGLLTIGVFGNTFHDYTSDVDIIASELPVVYGFHAKPTVGDFGSGEVLTPNDLDHAYVKDEISTAVYPTSVNYDYFAFVNESSYAQYISEITLAI